MSFLTPSKLFALALLVAFVPGCTKEPPTNAPVTMATGVAKSEGGLEPMELLSLQLNGGVDYGQLSLDSIVAFHNEAMEYLANGICASKVCPSNESIFREQVADHFERFLRTKGIDAEFKVNSIPNPSYFDGRSLVDPAYMMSSEGQLICAQIKHALDEYVLNVIAQHEFKGKIASIVQAANTLPDVSERKSIQLAAKNCEGSALFWQGRLTEMSGKVLCACDSTGGGSRAAIPWGGVAYADLAGAVQWGRVGLVAAGGPAGAVSCGLAGAIGHSGVRLLTFAIFGS